VVLEPALREQAKSGTSYLEVSRLRFDQRFVLTIFLSLLLRRQSFDSQLVYLFFSHDSKSRESQPADS
jgi:hypothetical protein